MFEKLKRDAFRNEGKQTEVVIHKGLRIRCRYEDGFGYDFVRYDNGKPTPISEADAKKIIVSKDR